MAEEDTIIITCSNGDVKMSADYVKMNKVLVLLSEDCPVDQGIPLTDMTIKTMEFIIVFCKEHLDNPCTEDPKKLDDWDLNFCASIYETSKVDLFNLYAASNYIDNSQLMDVCAKFLARQIKGKTAEEIRQEFSIKNDLTAEQEEEIRKKNDWCLDEKDDN